jgi:ribosomal protein S18 acetylase RimI-like enzyme
MATYLSKNDLEYTVDFGTNDDVLGVSAIFDYASEGLIRYYHDDLYNENISIFEDILEGMGHLHHLPNPQDSISEFSKFMTTDESVRKDRIVFPVNFDTDYYYKITNAVVAKHKNKIIGAAICLPHNNVNLTTHIRESWNAEKKAHIQVYIDNKVADAWYIENFGVLSPFQLQGVGNTILQKVKEHAESQSYDEVSTFVYDKNTNSKAFLESKGFTSDRTIDVSSHPFFQGISVSNIHRMRCSL